MSPPLDNRREHLERHRVVSPLAKLAYVHAWNEAFVLARSFYRFVLMKPPGSMAEYIEAKSFWVKEPLP